MALVRSIATIGGFTMLSRLLGFARDVLVAASLGAGLAADAFFVALQLPNLFRRLFAEGAFNTAFVPLFGSERNRAGEAAARRFAEQALSVLLFVLVLFVGAFMVAMPYVMLVLAPGFVEETAKFDLAVELSRITFPYLLLISLVSLLSGLLNSLGRFAEAAATQIFFNLCLILAVLIGRQWVPGVAHALAWGVTVSGILQFLWLVFACRRHGYDLRLRLPRLTPEIRKLLALILPAAVAAGATQIGLFVNLMIASLLPTGSVSFLFYADRLNQLPMGVIGVALGTALLPGMVKLLAEGKEPAALHLQNRALELGLLLTLPAAAALITIPHTLISVLFQRGAFDAAATAATAQALMAYAIGLPAFVLMRGFNAGFHARQDTRTPVRIALVSVAIGIALNLALAWPLQHVGLALAVSISAWLQSLLLARSLMRRGLWRMDQRLKQRLTRILMSSGAMVAILLTLDFGLQPWLQAGTVERVLALAAIVGLGMLAYAIACHLSRAATLAEFLEHLRRRPAPPRPTEKS